MGGARRTLRRSRQKANRGGPLLTSLGESRCAGPRSSTARRAWSTEREHSRLAAYTDMGLTPA